MEEIRGRESVGMGCLGSITVSTESDRRIPRNTFFFHLCSRRSVLNWFLLVASLRDSNRLRVEWSQSSLP